MVDVGFAVWLNWLGLFCLWQETTGSGAARLWSCADVFPLLCRQHGVTDYDRCGADDHSLFCPALKCPQNHEAGIRKAHNEKVAQILNTSSLSRITASWTGLIIMVGLSACASPMTQSCGVGQHQNISEMLYFGTGMADGQISNEQWQSFVDDVITPRFPQGLSIWPVYGQWQSASGTIIQEDSYVLNVMHAGEPGSEVAITEIMSSYKQQYQQEAVLRVQSKVCVSY